MFRKENMGKKESKDEEITDLSNSRRTVIQNKRFLSQKREKKKTDLEMKYKNRMRGKRIKEDKNEWMDA